MDKASNRPMSNRQKLAFEALVSFAAKHGEPLPRSFELPPNILARQSRHSKKNYWREASRVPMPPAA
jgi:hypothetical protein